MGSADDPEFSSAEDGDVEPGTPVIDNGAAATVGLAAKRPRNTIVLSNQQR